MADKRYRLDFTLSDSSTKSVEFTAPQGDTGATGQRGTGLLPVTTAPSSYTTETGGITPKYRMAIDTIKTQAGVTEVLLGDTVRYSYYHYPIAYLDSSYAYFTTRVSIRGATGAAGTSVTITSVEESSDDSGSNVVTFSDGNTLTIQNGSKGSTGSKGDKGDKGDTGATGADGKDYVLTSADKTEIAEQAAALVPSGGGGSGVDVTAEVGQTIIVKAVDSNGKPTEWEAADYQPRTHWEDGADVVLFDGTFSTTKVNKTTPLLPEFELSVGEKYLVTLDGVEYEVASYPDEDGFVNIGGQLLGSGYDYSEYPFSIGTWKDGDSWECGAACSTKGTHTLVIVELNNTIHKIDSKYLPSLEEMRTKVTEVLPETTAEYDEDMGVFMLPFVELVGGDKYKIVCNGVEYFSDILDAREDGVGGIVFGNIPLLMETGDNGIPFVGTMETDGETDLGYVMPLDGAETVTLSITQVNYTPIPVEYVSNALPYYIEVTGSGTDDDPYVCNDTVANVQTAYSNGRQIAMRLLYGDIWCIANLYGVMFEKVFGFASFTFQGGVTVNTVTTLIWLTPKADGTYRVDKRYPDLSDFANM